jgi:hydroxymethylglutaryl-CoA reductase (NADPH)
MLIPTPVLKQLYTLGSLKNVDDGVQLSITNRLSDAEVTGSVAITVNGQAMALDTIRMYLADGALLDLTGINDETPVAFPLRTVLRLVVTRAPLPKGTHRLAIAFDSRPFGKLAFEVEDSISDEPDTTSDEPDIPVKIPRHATDDYTPDIITARQAFVSTFTNTQSTHVWQYSFDPHLAKGNCEHFTGVAQVPLGFAGPLTIKGEHAQGDFLIPLATAEGTLVASYNRGMKLVNQNGGVTCTVVGDAMQRAPVFVFEDARQARDFARWVLDSVNFARIKAEAEASSHVAILDHIDPYLANHFVYLRFNFTTGDAAGQNMVGRATFAACRWVLDNYTGVKRLFLESNLATDKKASHLNLMRTRGKRVTAEITIRRDSLIDTMRVEPEQLAYFWGVAQIGSFLSGATNNGLHSANAIAAMFIATGQDVANVAESSAGVLYAELTPERDLYLSLTIPSLIVATFGGGVGLPTQRECLAMLGCEGRGSVYKFAEIVAGVALAGEISLSAAISSSEWVSGHERFGRNR